MVMMSTLMVIGIVIFILSRMLKKNLDNGPGGKNWLYHVDDDIQGMKREMSEWNTSMTRRRSVMIGSSGWRGIWNEWTPLSTCTGSSPGWYEERKKKNPIWSVVNFFALVIGGYLTIKWIVSFLF